MLGSQIYSNYTPQAKNSRKKSDVLSLTLTVY